MNTMAVGTEYIALRDFGQQLRKSEVSNLSDVAEFVFLSFAMMEVETCGMFLPAFDATTRSGIEKNLPFLLVDFRIRRFILG